MTDRPKLDPDEMLAFMRWWQDFRETEEGKKVRQKLYEYARQRLWPHTEDFGV